MPMINDTPFDQMTTLRDLISPKPVRVISVTGGKGGIGKTNIAINLAISLAAQKEKVLLLDADLGLANVDVLLNLKARKNISHVINGKAELEEIIIEGPKGIKIIPAASGIQQMSELNPMEHAGLIRCFSELTTEIDTLIVDTAAGISDHVMSFSRASQEVIVVVCNEPTSITDAYALIKVMSRNHGISKFNIVTNMTQNQSEGRRLFNKLNKATERFLNVTMEFGGAIPYDDYLRKAVKKQSAVLEAYPGSRSALAFKRLGQKVHLWPSVSSPQGHITFFLERILQNQQMEEGLLV